jgi:hypothetical protein
MKNPQAFPTHPDKVLINDGMTLRDYFAAKALQNFRDQIGSQSDQEWFDQMAFGAYRMADAMLKAREV